MMRISSINAYAPSFGQVRKSAVQRAIREADGDIEELKRIDVLIKEQKQNKKYDIEDSGFSEAYPYLVVNRKVYDCSYLLDSFKSACEFATNLEKDYLASKKKK